jgi:hypothetical protein
MFQNVTSEVSLYILAARKSTFITTLTLNSEKRDLGQRLKATFVNS